MNYWDHKGVPHKGWTCIGVEDLRSDGQVADETDYGSCSMCGNEKIRFVHTMRHPEFDKDLEVGCMCAEKMTDDYFSPKIREKELKSKADRRARWLQRRWRLSANGNEYMKIDGNHILVFLKKNRRWGYKLNDFFSEESYSTSDEAKLALFEKFWNTTQN